MASPVRVRKFGGLFCATALALLVAACQEESAPDPPASLAATPGDREVTLRWGLVLGADSYNLYWGTSPGVFPTTHAQIGGVTGPHTHTGRTNGTTYYYVVTAVSSAGESSRSLETSATPLSPAPPAPTDTTATPPPAIPTGVAVVPGNLENTIGWDPQADATQFNLYWATTPGVTAGTGSQILGATAPYPHTNLTRGTAYFYVVTAVSSAGESTESLEASGTPVGLVAKFVYTANNGAENVSAFTINEADGSLTEVADSPYLAGFQPRALVANPDGTFLFVVNGTGQTISVYAIDVTSGALTEQTAVGSPFAVSTGSNADSLAIDAAGQFLYVTHSSIAKISAYTIDSTSGALTPVDAGYDTGTTPRGIAVDPGGNFVWVANSGAADISGFAIDGVSGALTATTPAAFTGLAGMEGMAIDPAGGYVYAASTSLGQVLVFAPDPLTGVLTQVTGSPFTAGSGTFAVAVHPSGGLVAAANSVSNDVAILTVELDTGLLAEIAGSPVMVGSFPRSLAFDPTGKYLYVGNANNNTVSAFVVSETGDLTPTSPATFATGASPWSIVVVGKVE